MFSRASEPAEQKADAGSPGILVVAARDRRPEAKAGADSWRAQERAEIRGASIDHATLAEFVRRLGEQSGVSQVRLLDTSTRSYPGLDVVDFQLAAVLDTVAGPVPTGTAP